MAEGFLRHEAEKRGLVIETRSTGTHAWNGRAATIEGRRVMNEHGVSIDDHRTIELDRDLVDWADLLIGMSREHVRETVRTFPDAAEKTFTMKGILELLGSLPPYTQTVAWLDAAASMRERAESISDADIDDPIGEREAAYARVAKEIRDLVERFAEGLERSSERLTT